MKPVWPASPRFPAPSWPLCENMPRRRLRQAAHTTPLCVLCAEGKMFVQHSRSDNITMEKTRSPLWTDVFFPFFCPCDIRLHVTLWVCTVTTVVMSCLHIRAVSSAVRTKKGRHFKTWQFKNVFIFARWCFGASVQIEGNVRCWDEQKRAYFKTFFLYIFFFFCCFLS